jgi:hypothetical protein
MIPEIVFLKFVGICAILNFFGVAYAYLIARRAFPPALVWLSVFVTVFGEIALRLLLDSYVSILTHNLLPVVCFGLTGFPMILGQVVKHTIQDGGVVIPLLMEDSTDGDPT